MRELKSKSAISLEVSRVSGKIKVSAYIKSSEDEKTIRPYEIKDISDSEISKICSSVVNLLNSSNQRGKMDRQSMSELQSAGQLLYDSLLTDNVKIKLSASRSENLIMIIDDSLVHIPWELLYDGNSFLCLRFNIGRIVRTSQRISGAAVRKVNKPMKMLLIADPRSDLEAAYREGICLRDELDGNLDVIEVNLRSSNVDVTSLKRSLRDYDILHYAGHADYNSAVPSESAFLMQDGKFTASDVINMTGSNPLPSLVFSNACKSGQTDIWKVRENYETEIYGLANAFLLAGVQHYIGTFWDVMDEPSMHFALDFYKELIKGSMVGEAIKKARSGLISRYGNDTVIWASYMLYGDPTATYAASSISINSDNETSNSDLITNKSERETEFAGGVRGADTEIVFPQKRQKWMLISFPLLIIFSIIIVITLRSWNQQPPPEQNKVNKTPSRALRMKRVDGLVASLIKDYRENKKPKQGTADKSRLPTMVFLDIKYIGITESDKEYIFTRVADILQNSRRVNIVEREILDALLEELKLSSSQLINPANSLEIGKILSAQIISTGNITKDGKSWQISLRLIDTETTSINAAITAALQSGQREEVAIMLSQQLLNKIRTAYPLQGKIISFNGKNPVINMGYKNGITLSSKMKVFSDSEGKVSEIGTIEITSADENTSTGNIIEIQGEYKEGLRVEEFL